MSKFISVTLFLLFMFVSIHSSQQNVEWRGTIEEVDGVTVVKNPKEPMYREDVFRLDEELSIFKTRGGDEPKFRMVKSIAVDDFGNIYILDIPKIHVLVFDKNGAFLKTIGEEEKELGPTEIISLEQNQIVIRNLKKRKLKYYALNGEFIRTLSMDKANFGFSQMAIDTKGNIYSSISFEDKENAKLELQKFDSNLNYLYSFGYSMLLEQKVFKAFSPRITWAITKEDNIVFGKPDEYLIKIFSTKGKLIKKITREYEPIAIPQAEKDRWKKKEGGGYKISIPEYYPAYENLITDDEGRIFVRTWEKAEKIEGYYYDVFDTEGRYVAKIFLKVSLRIWKKDKLYTIEKDKEGYQVIKRYKVTWKF